MNKEEIKELISWYNCGIEVMKEDQQKYYTRKREAMINNWLVEVSKLKSQL